MTKYDVAIVGAGFTGLVAAFELAKAGKSVCILEKDSTPGGLAGVFEFPDGTSLEKFYHHWFNNDRYVPELVDELGLSGDVITLPSRTGMYFNGRLWRLSTPLDLLKFNALSFIDRVRLGLLVFQVRRVRDWRKIEHLSIREWLEPLCGKKVFEVVWEPLLDSKFSIFKDDVTAVWMWKKLVLRGGTRNKTGGEELAYFKGGFGRLTEKLASTVTEKGATIKYGTAVVGARREGDRLVALETDSGVIEADEFISTTAFPITADILQDVAPEDWIKSLRRINYLGNLCLVLRMDRSLSDTYWINVNDPGFPFVGVIEHTNFDRPENYKNSHIIYLSRYLATSDPIWEYSDEEYLEFAFKHLVKMFPDLDKSWIQDYSVWRADYAQPVTERNYSQYMPATETPLENVVLSTMAHIYPEDRGTNYAIREGRAIAARVLNK